METIIFSGIPASGKSTFYQEHFRNTHLRINLDMLKTRRREQIIFQACLEAKQPFVVDNTNITPEIRARYIIPARAARFRIIGYCFNTELEAALERNRQRPAQWVVPDKGIVATQRRFRPPSLEEGYDALFVVTLSPSNVFEIQAWR